MKKSYSFYMMIGSLIATMLILLGMKYPAPLYSPGDITEKHSKLRCSDCHAPFKRVPSESCSVTDCHIAGEIGNKDAVKDLHNSIKGRDCLVCHTDHKGLKGKITIAFDHKELPEKVRCADCHITDGEKAHKGKYGDRCKACHTTKNWKAGTFSHDKVTETTCVDCHKGPKDDLHASSGDDCKACHGTKGWKPATLDHDRYFPLDKEHMVACNKCHEVAKNYKVYTCMNCHVHATRGIIKEHAEEGIRNYSDCLRCHRVYMKGRTYGTDKTGEGESMIDDDDHKYRGYDRKRRDHDDDDDDHDRKGLFEKWFGDDD